MYKLKWIDQLVVVVISLVVLVCGISCTLWVELGENINCINLYEEDQVSSGFLMSVFQLFLVNYRALIMTTNSETSWNYFKVSKVMKVWQFIVHVLPNIKQYRQHKLKMCFNEFTVLIVLMLFVHHFHSKYKSMLLCFYLKSCRNKKLLGEVRSIWINMNNY